MYGRASIEDLKGQTLKSITSNDYAEELIFETVDGKRYKMWHAQDCCESASLEEAIGNLEDLIGSPILEAEEVSSSADKPYNYCESWTWTFYKLATIKGHVTLRWLGTSNGYYSESVDFSRID